jgi:hypothetical protein
MVNTYSVQYDFLKNILFLSTWPLYFSFNKLMQIMCQVCDNAIVSFVTLCGSDIAKLAEMFSDVHPQRVRKNFWVA